MHLEEVAIPIPENQQVLIKVHAAGVNPLDVVMRAGGDYGLPMPSLPFTPGFDVAGTVVQVGDGVSKWKQGDRVYANGSYGGYAENVVCSEEDVYSLPANISFREGAALGAPATTAYYTLVHLAKSKPGETVLIHGASGGVGVMAVQIARSLGLTVLGTAGTEAGRKLVESLGAQHVLDHHSPNYLEEVVRLTDGNGADIILEMVGDLNLGADLEVVASRGRILVIGANRQESRMNPITLIGKGATIFGVNGTQILPQILSEIHAKAFEALEKGSLRSIIGAEFLLSEAPEAHRIMEKGGLQGKIILVME